MSSESSAIDASGAPITVHVNPITDLVAVDALGDAATDDGLIGAALGSVDPVAFAARADERVRDLFGAAIDFARFASDPDFGAETPDTAGTAADAILDALAETARGADQSTGDYLHDLTTTGTPPRLLEQGAFQVTLVGDLLIGGVSADELIPTLHAIDADPGASSENDTLAATIDILPQLIAQAAAASGVADNPELLEVVARSTVRLVARSLEQRRQRFGGDGADTVTLLSTASFQNTITTVVDGSIGALVEAVQAEPDLEALIPALDQVADRIAMETAVVLAGIAYPDDGNVSTAVAGFVRERVLRMPLDAATVREVMEGTGLDAVVADTGGVDDAQRSIGEFVRSNPDLLPIDPDAIRELPVGRWDADTWDDFKWG